MLPEVGGSFSPDPSPTYNKLERLSLEKWPNLFKKETAFFPGKTYLPSLIFVVKVGNLTLQKY
jgi:hypothetical protein